MRAWGFVGGLVVAASSNAVAFAQSAENAAPEPESAQKSVNSREAQTAPPSVQITLVGDDAHAAALGQKIASWFGPETTVSTSTKPVLEPNIVLMPSDQVGIRIWIWLRSASEARLFFSVEPHAHAPTRYLVNDVALERGLDELGAEELAQVVHFSALGLWQGNVESSRDEVEQRLPEPAPEPTPEVRAPTRPAIPDEGRLSFRLGAEGSFRGPISDGLFVHDGGGLALFRLRRETALGGMLHVEFARATNPPWAPTAKFRETSARLGFLFEQRISSWTWASVQLGPGVDFLGYRSPNSNGTKVLPLVYGAMGTRFVLGPVSVWSGISPVLQLADVRFVTTNYGGGTKIIGGGSWIVQPGALVGIYW